MLTNRKKIILKKMKIGVFFFMMQQMPSVIDHRYLRIPTIPERCGTDTVTVLHGLELFYFYVSTTVVFCIVRCVFTHEALFSTNT